MNSKILNKNIKFTFVFSLIIIVISIFISIGYATVSTNIWFNTMVYFSAPPVGITSVSCDGGGGGFTCSGSISSANAIGMSAGSSSSSYNRTYTITVKNSSTVDKTITNASWGGGSITVVTPIATNTRIKPGETKTFTYVIAGGSSYGGTLTLTYGNYTITKMVDYSGATNYLGCSNIPRTSIERIDFQTNTTAPSGTVQTCNVDVGGAGKIKAFATDTNNNGKYEIKIGSVDGEVFAGQATHIAQSLTNLTTINTANFNTKYTTDMSYMFYNCTSLVNIYNFGTLDTSNVTTMASMFENVSARNTGLTVSTFNTANVQSMAKMFKGMTNLPSLNVKNFNLNKVVTCQEMFKDCTNLKTIYANSTWTKASAGTDSGMFTGCTNLKGGNGTTYNASNVGISYARIDTASNKGYFTS